MAAPGSPRQLGPIERQQSGESALIRWLKRLLGLGRKPAPDAAAPRMPRELEKEIRAALPPDAQLQDWPEKRSVQSELPRARAALSLTEQKLTAVFADLNNGKAPAVESVHAAMDHVVASMIDNPNALLWVTHLRQAHAQSYQHSLSVALHMVALGRHLGFPRARLVEIGMVGLLADIGKVRVAPGLRFRAGVPLREADARRRDASVARRHPRARARGRRGGARMSDSREQDDRARKQELSNGDAPAGPGRNAFRRSGPRSRRRSRHSALGTGRTGR